MKFKPVLPGAWKPAEWKWVAKRAQKRAKRAALHLEALFPLSFVPESSGTRRSA